MYSEKPAVKFAVNEKLKVENVDKDTLSHYPKIQNRSTPHSSPLSQILSMEPSNLITICPSGRTSAEYSKIKEDPFSKLGNNETSDETPSPSTRPLFSKMGHDEVPHDAPSASPSASTKIPPSLDFSLDKIIFPGSFQALTSSLQHKSPTNGSPLVSPSTKPTILPSTEILPATSMIPSKYSTYFLSDQPSSTSTSTLRRDISISPAVQSTLAPSHIPSSLNIFETSCIPNSPPGLFPSDVSSDLPRPSP